MKWVLRAQEHGLLPMDGNGLSQTQSFLDAWDYFTNDLRFWEAKGA